MGTGSIYMYNFCIHIIRKKKRGEDRIEVKDILGLLLLQLLRVNCQFQLSFIIFGALLTDSYQLFTVSSNVSTSIMATLVIIFLATFFYLKGINFHYFFFSLYRLQVYQVLLSMMMR